MASNGMQNIVIRLFPHFVICVDGREIQISRYAKEFLALLTAAGGNPVTARGLWDCTERARGFSYSSRFYLRACAELQRELRENGCGELVQCDVSPVRACRINRDLVICDYYRMLDGELPMGGREAFLSDYVWAAPLLCESWQALHEFWISRYLS